MACDSLIPGAPRGHAPLLLLARLPLSYDPKNSQARAPAESAWARDVSRVMGLQVRQGWSSDGGAASTTDVIGLLQVVLRLLFSLYNWSSGIDIR